MRINLRALIASPALIAVAVPAIAAEWKHELAPYVWGSAMDGATALGHVTADVDMSFGDVLENLETSFMGIYRASRDGWSVTVDGVYMGLGGHGQGPAGYVNADVDFDQTALQIDVGYEVVERLGGFGVGSDVAWQAIATTRWQATKNFGVVAAYRYVDMDYEDGQGGNYFNYDMAVSGPAVGVVFTF